MNTNQREVTKLNSPPEADRQPEVSRWQVEYIITGWKLGILVRRERWFWSGRFLELIPTS